MPVYATTSSFPDLLPYFMAGNTTTGDAVALAALAKHIQRAEDVVKAHIVSRYDLSSFISGAVPPFLTMLTEDVASYYAIRGIKVVDGVIGNKSVTEYREAATSAFELLKQLQKGEVGLVNTAGSSVSPRTTSRFLSSTLDYAPIFELDEPDAWQVDDDRLDDVEDARE